MSWGVATQNGVSVSLASIVSLSAGVTEFSPIDLFTGGTVGAWYDPSDYSTLFQDSAGTTPVTAVEQPVGLMLDKSQGLVLGPQLITNGDFSNGTTSWTPNNATLAVASNELEVTVTTASSPSALQDFSTVVGMTYEVTGTIRAPSANTTVNAARIVISTPSVVFAATSEDVSIPVRFVFVATLTTTRINLQVASSGAFGAIGDKAYFDNISVKELPGNHASQATSTSRPVLRARYNLLTYSEQFDNAAWSKLGSTITANAATAPDGTSTADKLVESAAAGFHYTAQNISVTGAVFSVYVKAAERTQVALFLGGISVGVGFDLSTGTTTTISGWSSGAPTSSITSVGAGWYRITIYTAGAMTNVQLGIGNAGAGSYTGDGTSGIYVWGAQVVTGSSAGTYQRIAAATDYATAGFLPYLAFDGTDDSFGTNSINFSATDKMSVCAGVTKLSDAAAGTLVELTADATANNGGFALRAPDSATSNYGAITRGTIASNTRLATTYAAPITNVFTTLLNNGGALSSDQISVRINAVTPTLSAGTTTIAGNFANAAMYIGRRNNATVPLNGRIYQLVVCGKTLSASELASTEAYVATKTGVTL